MRGKIRVRKQGGRKQKIKIRYMVAAAALVCAAVMPQFSARAESCPSLRVVFARGSGGERWEDQNYLAWKKGIEEKLQTVDLDYEFIDLDYPAVGVGIDNLGVTLGAFFGSGDAYEFGRSVNTGVKNLKTMINSAACPGTKYVIGGYSQGAMVVSKALGSLNADRLIYAATFGDPKLYLPEGKGVIPAACSGKNLSDYRMYVPDCQAYKGLLGAYIPYEPEALTGKVGTWCNKRDVFCSSHLNVTDHVSYVAEDLYEDASRVVFDKITKTFGLENHISSPHDTAILIDSTTSMEELIGRYKAEALRLARETLDAGGRVALFDYRDLDDPYALNQHCDFDTCTLEKFRSELSRIRVDGGGDLPESLLSASWHAMKALTWKKGSTKSLVVLTNANFVSPDRDEITLDEVARLSRQIDPVNFYVITPEIFAEDYEWVVSETGGKVVTDLGELSLLTDYIMERYDSLPRVDVDTTPQELPALTVDSVEWTSSNSARMEFTTTGTRTLVTLNGLLLGTTTERSIVLTGLDTTEENIVTLVPLGDDVRGEAMEVDLMGVLKVPNTGIGVGLPR